MPGTLLHVLNALTLLRPPLRPLGNGVQRNNEPAQWRPGKEWGQGMDPPSVPEPGLVTAPTEQASPPHLRTPHTRASIASPAAARHSLTPTRCWAGRAAREHPPTPSSVHSGNQKVKTRRIPPGQHPVGEPTSWGLCGGPQEPREEATAPDTHPTGHSLTAVQNTEQIQLLITASPWRRVCPSGQRKPALSPAFLHLLPHSRNEFLLVWFGLEGYFIEIQCTYRKTHPFKVYHSVGFSVFTGLGNHHHDLIPEHFHHPKQTLASLAVTPHSPCPSQSPAAARLRPAPVDVPVWTSHLSGITGHMAFRVWLLSLSTMFPRVTVS